jgi:site-specific DNA recombinase
MKQVKEQSSNGADHTRYAAIYARVSTEDQGKGYSIPTQIDACQKSASEQGYIVSEAHIFIDDGVSGTTLDRPALRQLREVMSTRALAAVVVLDPDRLARKTGKLLVLKDEMDEAGVKLICVSHRIEDGAEGSLFFQMRGVLAEYEREKMLERTRRGLLGRIKAGYPHGGGVPLGYQYVSEPHRGAFVVDEEEAPLVRRIFEMYVDGMNLRAIARQLTLEKVPTHHDRRGTTGRKIHGVGVWSTPSIGLILRNETYIGRLYWNKRKHVGKSAKRRDRREWVAIQVPAIIAEELFLAVQQKIAQNKALSKRNRKHEYLFLAGRLRCGRCGGGMSGYSAHDRRRYRCLSQVWHPSSPQAFCRGQVLAEAVEGPVWQVVERILNDPAVIVQELERRRRTSRETEHEAMLEMKVIHSAMSKLDRELRQWEHAYANAVLTLDEFKIYKLDIQERRAMLLAEEESIQESLRKVADHEVHMEFLKTYCRHVQSQLKTLDIPVKRLALEAFEIQATWTPAEPIRIAGSVPIDDIVYITPLAHSTPPISASTSGGSASRP